MALHATISDPVLITSPLTRPLTRRLPSGRFGAPRDSDATAVVIGGTNVAYTPKRLHEGVDLEAKVGDPVFAVTDGVVVVSTVNAGSDKGPAWVVLDHHPTGRGHISCYFHLSVGLARGTMVSEGELIGLVGTHPTGSHLHFELRHVVDPTGNLDSDRTSVAVDPSPFLERFSFDDAAATETGAAKIEEYWVMQHSDLHRPYLRLRLFDDATNYFISLERPSADDEQMISVLKEAFVRRLSVRLRTVLSAWHDGRHLIRGVRLS